jgi:hypothetical protein
MDAITQAQIDALNAQIDYLQKSAILQVLQLQQRIIVLGGSTNGN